MDAAPAVVPFEPSTPSSSPRQTRRSSAPRNLFVYLCAMASLYMGSMNLGTVLFQLINAALPDPLDPPMAAGPLRWSVASLFVIFPIFVWASRTILRERLAEPAIADSKVRQWLVHLTIFLAGAVVAGDLIGLMYNLLEGELTTRFLLKVGVVLIIAGAIFSYYLQDLRRSSRAMAPIARAGGAVAGILVISAIVAGIVTSGSPFRQRLVRFDDQKVSDLREIQKQVVNYWRHKQTLPPALDSLNDPLSGFQVPTDPQTGTAYEYRVTGPHAFELCAQFNRDSKGARVEHFSGRSRLDESWRHESGRHCFPRSIDPELYPRIREGTPE